MLNFIVDSPDLAIRELVNINYLVGVNGSGKNHALEIIRERNQATIISKDQVFELINNPEKILELSRNIIQKGSSKILIIKDPENGMHPQMQRQIPNILNQLFLGSKSQIFVSTNSPFVVAALGELTQIEQDTYAENRNKNRTFSPKQKFTPSQKVYVLKSGKIASRTGEVITNDLGQAKGQYGYWGKKANFVASQMLSSGLSPSKSSFSKRTITSDAPILILCEGYKSEADALIYNQIFEVYKGRSILFVSCQGTHELSTSFDVFRQIKNSLSANFELLMLRDRDHEFPDLPSIIKYSRSYPNRRVLFRRAIECYLYSSETAELVLNTIGKSLSNYNRIKMDKLQNKIQSEAESEKLGHDYKIRLKELFAHITQEYRYEMDRREQDNPHFKFSVHVLAPLITPETETYKELAKWIFLE